MVRVQALMLLLAPGARGGGNLTAGPWAYLYEDSGNACFNMLNEWDTEQPYVNSAAAHCLVGHAGTDRRVLKEASRRCAASAEYKEACTAMDGKMCQFNGVEPAELGGKPAEAYTVDLCVPANCTDEQLLMTEESGRLSESISCPDERKDIALMVSMCLFFLVLQGCCWLFVAKTVASRQLGWRSSILSCHTDIGTSCFVWLCPCLQWGQIILWAGPDAFEGTPRETGKCRIDNRKTYAQLYKGARQLSVLSQRGGCCCCGGWRLFTSLAVIYVGMQVAMLFLSGYSFLAVVVLGAMGRDALRRRLGIEGQVIEDLALHCCLNQCALCQEAREIEASFSQLGGGRRRQQHMQQQQQHALQAPLPLVVPLAPVVALPAATTTMHVNPAAVAAGQTEFLAEDGEDGLGATLALI